MITANLCCKLQQLISSACNFEISFKVQVSILMSFPDLTITTIKVKYTHLKCRDLRLVYSPRPIQRFMTCQI